MCSSRPSDSQLSHIWCGGDDLISSGWCCEKRIHRLNRDIRLRRACLRHHFRVRAHNFPAPNASSKGGVGVPGFEAKFAEVGVMLVVILIKRRIWIEMLNLLELPEWLNVRLIIPLIYKPLIQIIPYGYTWINPPALRLSWPVFSKLPGLYCFTPGFRRRGDIAYCQEL